MNSDWSATKSGKPLQRTLGTRPGRAMTPFLPGVPAPSRGYLIAIACSFLCCTAAHADDQFRRLSSKEIRKTIAGKQITDGFHWADQFFPDGSGKYVTMGRTKNGPWTVKDDQLCTVSRARKSQAIECVEIWRSGSTIQYRQPDGFVMTEGTLKPLDR